jgi:hypothetical protein
MKKQILFILLIYFPICLLGQPTDSSLNHKFNHNFFSINPVNALFCQQAGISYEYMTYKFGIEISSGYFYPTHLFYSKWGIEGFGKNDGSIYPFQGYYLIPQINLYLPKNKTNVICYFSIKGVYRKLHCDSTEFYFWHKDDNDNDYWIYRKQDDHLSINGVFLLVCIKQIKKHFFLESYFGPGIIHVKHDMYVAGENCGEDPYIDQSNIKPPIHDIVNYSSMAISIGINFGFRF